MDMIIKIVNTLEKKYKDCECYLEYTRIRNDLLIYKCLFFCNRNCDKNVYPYEGMDDSVKFNGSSLFEKEDFHVNLKEKILKARDKCLKKFLNKQLS